MSATGTEARVCADIAERQKMGGDRELLELAAKAATRRVIVRAAAEIGRAMP